MFAIWLGELISEYGIRGQGLSLIIFAGIVARIPANFGSLLADTTNGWILVIAMALVMVAVIFAIVYVQQGRRNVPVMYPGRRVGNRMSMPVKGTLAVDGQPGRHDPANLCQCHPAISHPGCLLDVEIDK